MSRIGRFVIPDLPHHVTQRGNRGDKVFFGDDHYALYRDLLAESRRRGNAVGNAVTLAPFPKTCDRWECAWNAVTLASFPGTCDR
jgi:hypothetical protein